MRGICGHSATGQVYHYYSCPGRSLGRTCTRKNIPQDVLENLVVRTVADKLLRPETIEQLADALFELQQAEASRPNAEQQAIEADLADVRRKLSNVLDAIENGTASAALTSRLSGLEQREKDLSFQLSSLESKKPLSFTRDQFVFLLQQFQVTPSERTKAYCRRLVDTFVRKIELTSTELILYFNISEETENKQKSASIEPSKKSSTETRLVRVARIELTAS